MKLTLYRSDLRPEFEGISFHESEFKHFNENAQRAIVAVGRAVFIAYDYGNYNPKSKKMLLYLKGTGEDMTRLPSEITCSAFVKTSLAGSDLTRITFRGCDLREADFRGAILNETAMLYCDLRGAKFDNGPLVGLDTTGSIIVDGASADEDARKMLAKQERIYSNRN